MTRITVACALLSLIVVGCGDDEASEPAVTATGGMTGGSLSGGGGGAGSGAASGSGGSGGSAVVVPMLDSGAPPQDAGVDSGAIEDAASDAAPVEAGYSEDPGDEGDGDLEIDVPYVRDPALTDQGNPEGREFNFKMALADSAIFKGDDATLDPGKPVRVERNIWVYVPNAYRDGDGAPVLVMHDGSSQLDLVRYALDNLTVSSDPVRTLPAFIAVSVENGGNDSKGSERGLEYDTMSDRFARFIHEEVLPAVLSNAQIKAAFPGIAFTSNPWGKATMGCSSGGAAALSMAWFRPDYFRRVISYSGTFVDQQDDDAPEEAMYPLGAWEYHSGLELIASAPQKPLRIFIHVSQNDLGAEAPEAGHHNWVLANQRTAAALAAKGYHHRFVYSLASGHCERAVFEHTLADSLLWLWRGYHD
jgi:enterochelin esterase-like enzyme